MKKAIILSYFYPPSNFAGSYRMQAWAENLHKFGYYPIVVTRHWAQNETDYTAISDQNNTTKEEYPTHTIYRLPYKGSLRDRTIRRLGKKAVPLGKIFSLFQVVGQNFFLRSCPYNNLYYFTRELLKNEDDLKIVLTSGRPFIHFKFAYLLKKEFKNIHWIADYRDPWNTCQNISKSFKLSFLKFVESSFEKKWIQNAYFITTVSQGLMEGLSTLHKSKPIKVITNGFNSFIDCEEIKEDHLIISYIGSLYPEQKIEVFLNGYLKFISSLKKPDIVLKFFGLGVNKIQQKRVSKILNKRSSYYHIYDWIEKSKLIDNVCNSHYFLISGLKKRKGTYTAKIYDYFALQKNIILCPSDNDVLEETILETNTGVVLNSEEEVYTWIKNAYNQWKIDGSIPYNGKRALISEFKYENQVKKLAGYLEKLPD